MQQKTPTQRQEIGNTALIALQEEMQLLRLKAGQPSLRSIAKKIGWSHSTVARVFTFETVPRWDILEQITLYLGGEDRHIRSLWMACMDQKAAPKPESAAPIISDRLGQQRFPALSASAAVCSFLIVAIYLDIKPDQVHRNQVITDGAQLIFGLTACVLWWIRFAQHRKPAELAFALGITGWSTGMACWFIIRDTLGISPLKSPSPVDGLYLTFPLFVIPGLILLFPIGAKRLAVTASSVLFFLGVISVLAILLELTDIPHGAAVTHALYLTTDIIMVCLAAFVAIGSKEWTWRITALGILGLFTSDAIFATLDSIDYKRLIPYGADIGYLVLPLALSVAARCNSRRGGAKDS